MVIKLPPHFGGPRGVDTAADAAALLTRYARTFLDSAIAGGDEAEISAASALYAERKARIEAVRDGDATDSDKEDAFSAIAAEF